MKTDVVDSEIYICRAGKIVTTHHPFPPFKSFNKVALSNLELVEIFFLGGGGNIPHLKKNRHYVYVLNIYACTCN